MRKIRIALAAGLLLSLGTVAFAVASPGQDAEIATYDFALLFNNDGGATAFCPNGSVAVGGGVGYSSASTPNLGVNVSGPANSSELTSHTRSGDTARVWNSSVYSGTGSEVDLKTFAICCRSAGPSSGSRASRSDRSRPAGRSSAARAISGPSVEGSASATVPQTASTSILRAAGRQGRRLRRTPVMSPAGGSAPSTTASG